MWPLIKVTDCEFVGVGWNVNGQCADSGLAMDLVVCL